MIAPEKDVDGLGETAPYTPATPMAILWLLAGYNVNLEKSRIALVGRGKLVGAPLIDIFTKSGYDFVLIHSKTPNTKELLLEADLHPAGTLGSFASGISEGGQQAGKHPAEV